MHTRRLFNVFLVGLLVPFGGCDNVPEPKTWLEEDHWEEYNLRGVKAFDSAAEASIRNNVSIDFHDTPALEDYLGLLALYGAKSQNPNAVCPFGEDRGTHVDTLIQRFKEKVAKAGKHSPENPLD
jgi:hypothetical protein